MPNPNDANGSTGSNVDRRMLIRGVLAVGGVTALAGSAAAASPEAQAALVSEREWARTLARDVANQLPEAARQLPNLGLNSDQVEQLRRVFENTLLTNMGCTLPPGQGS